MKTTKLYLVVCLTFILTQFNAFAQYNGGNSHGSTANELSNTSCSIPAHFYAYFGGNNDGSSVSELSTTSCGTAAFQFAYMGGNADGAATEELSTTACGIPPSFFAYMGGNNDGAGVETFEQSACPFPPQFYAYFGGDGDGFALDKTAPICPTEPPVASFTASVTEICVGQSVAFTDTSTNIPSAWTWTFEGGNPSSSTDQNPTITYTTPGVYNVTLVAANFNGTDTEIVTDYITVYAYPTITSTTPNARCDAGIVTLQATTNVGTLNWYDAPTGGNLVGTGTSFTTPSISTTTAYYVESLNGVCSSARTSVTATITSTPTITSTTPNSRCDAGSVTLNATSSAGNTVWYSLPSGGTALATTNSFVTPSISLTTTYYVQATLGSCSSSRTAVIATVNTTPIITSTTPNSRCDAGSVTLNAVANAGTINWFSVPSGGSSVATGTSFTTPSISSTTIYYVEATSGTCTSVRTAVTATVNTTPTITSTTPSSRCDAGTVTLSSSSSAGNVVWYANSTGGTSLATTNSYTTPSISLTTTYYVEAVNGSCASGTRTAVIATINPSPTITSTTPTTICGGDTFTISATASAGTLAWYNVPTGGIVQGTGNDFSISNWGTTTTFYVQATNGSCQSARIPVNVTVNERPFNTTLTPASRCGSGSVTLAAAYTVGTINWYSVPSGGTSIGTGSSFVTPTISSTTTYYVEAVNNGCVSSIRTAINATVTSTNSPTGAANQSFCAGETVGLISVTGSDIIWYNAPTNGTVIPAGTTIISGTTYYASQTVGLCESQTRLAVTMTLGGCLGIDDFEKNNIKIYPNPTKDIITVASTQQIESVEVVNLLGQILFVKQFNSMQDDVDLSNLPTATYMLRINGEDGAVKISKVIKK